MCEFKRNKHPKLNTLKVRFTAIAALKIYRYLIKSNKNFSVFEHSEFRGNFYCLQYAACGFFALAIKYVNFCQPREFSWFVLLLNQKNEHV